MSGEVSELATARRQQSRSPCGFLPRSSLEGCGVRNSTPRPPCAALGCAREELLLREALRLLLRDTLADAQRLEALPLPDRLQPGTVWKAIPPGSRVTLYFWASRSASQAEGIHLTEMLDQHMVSVTHRICRKEFYGLLEESRSNIRPHLQHISLSDHFKVFQ